MSERNDSRQLHWLRRNYREIADRSQWSLPATALRLGMYSAATSAKIDDYGSHSRRWCSLFEQGFLKQIALMNVPQP